MAPISKLVQESMIDQGLPYYPDMFSTGEVAQGCGDVPRTIYEGIRTTSADFITKGYRRDNITIKTDTHVDRIIFSTDSGVPTATSVVTLTSDKQEIIYHARKEIIISAGTYCSPTILLRSGIGAASELSAHNIPVVSDLPEVGKNLQDHPLTFIFYEVNKADLTNDHLVHHGNSLESSVAQWQKDQTGVLSKFPFGTFGYARLDDRLASNPLWVEEKAKRKDGRDPMGLTQAQPNVEFWNTEYYFGPGQFDKFPSEGKYSFAITVLLFGQQSRGSVKLQNKDPLEKPIVDHNYLDNPLDLLVVSEACQMANEVIMKGKGTKDIVSGAWPDTLRHHKYTKGDQWVEYVKENATTCE
jgi:choline dehydrogenase-like flavoprotein